MKKQFLVPGMTLLAGLAGFLLRKWELSTAFEPDTSLPVTGAPAALALLFWSAAVALALICLCAKEKGSLPYDIAFQAEGNTAWGVTAALSGFLLLLSAGAEIITYPITYQTYQNAVLNAEASGKSAPSPLPVVLPALRIAFCVLGFLCVLLIVRNIHGNLGKGEEHLPLLAPCALFCVWLISDYQLRATDPVVQNYLYEVFAICASLLGFFEIATYSFQKGRPRRTLVIGLLGVYFSLVTMADGHTLAELFRYGFAVLFLTAHAVLLLGEHPAGEDEAPATKTEADPHG